MGRYTSPPIKYARLQFIWHFTTALRRVKARELNIRTHKTAVFISFACLFQHVVINLDATRFACLHIYNESPIKTMKIAVATLKVLTVKKQNILSVTGIISVQIRAGAWNHRNRRARLRRDVTGQQCRRTRFPFQLTAAFCLLLNYSRTKFEKSPHITHQQFAFYINYYD